jgi:hypothetical protein
MTKKELSDMALGVRELSKRLGMYPPQLSSLRGFAQGVVELGLIVGGAKMKLKVKTIIIITKKNDHMLVGMTRQVTDFLLYHSAGKRDPYTMSPFPPPLPQEQLVDN